MGPFPHFGTINEDDESPSVEVLFKGHLVIIDLFLDEIDEIDTTSLGQAIELTKDISQIDELALSAVANDFYSLEGFATESYRDFVSELALNNKKIREQAPMNSVGGDISDFIELLHLDSIGIFPANNEECLMLDYTIGRDLMDQVLTVLIDINGSISRVGFES